MHDKARGLDKEFVLQVLCRLLRNAAALLCCIWMHSAGPEVADQAPFWKLAPLLTDVAGHLPAAQMAIIVFVVQMHAWQADMLSGLCAGLRKETNKEYQAAQSQHVSIPECQQSRRPSDRQTNLQASMR